MGQFSAENPRRPGQFSVEINTSPGVLSVDGAHPQIFASSVSDQAIFPFKYNG